MSSFLGSALGDAVGSVGSFMNAPRLDAIPESDSRISSAQFASQCGGVEGDAADLHACQCAIREMKDDIGQIRTEQSQAMDTLGQLTVSIAESLKSAMQRFEKRLMSEMDVRCEALERKISEQAKKWQSSTAASERAPSIEASGARSPSLGKSPLAGAGSCIKDSLNGFGGLDSLAQSNRSVSTAVSEKKQPPHGNFANKFGKIAASIEQSFQSLKDGQQALDDTASDHGSTGTGPSRISFGGATGLQREPSDLDLVSNASSATNQSGAPQHQALLAKGGARAQSEDIMAYRPEARQQQQPKPDILTAMNSGLSGRSRPVTRDRDRPYDTSPAPSLNGRTDKSPTPPGAYEGLGSGKSAEMAASLRRHTDRAAAFRDPRSGARSPTGLSRDAVQFRPEGGYAAAASATPHSSSTMGAARGASMGLTSNRTGLSPGAAQPGVMMGQQQPRASSVQGAMMGGAPKYSYNMGRR